MLASLALSAVLACSASSALATAGGASAPTGATPQSVPGKSASLAGSGIATWYGPGLYGRRTACGQTLTQLVVGVANRTLPCGTLVKVGFGSHTLVVPVIDRGPYGHGAEWDLTAGAAVALGVTETVRISAKVVGITPNSPTLGAPAAEATPTAAGGALAG